MPLRDGAIYILGRSVPGALSFLTAILLTWLLPPEEYGLYGLGMAVIMLGNTALFEWLDHALIRWYQSHQEEPAFMPTVLALFAGPCLASLLLLALAHASGLTGDRATEAWIFLYGIWAHGWFEFTSRIQVCRFRPVRYLSMNVLRSGLILAGTALVAHLTRSGEAVLLVAFTAMLVAGSLFLADGSIRLRRVFDPVLARALLAYGGPMFLTLAFGGLMTSLSPALIGALSTRDAIGGFTISFTLVQATLGVIAQGVNAANWPFALRAVETGDAAAARMQLSRNFALLLGVVLPAGVGLALLAPGIARLFVNPAYHEAVARTAPWLSACAVLAGLRVAYVDSAFQLGKRPGLLVYVTAVGALVNLGLGAVLIPRWSHVGAAVAMTCAFALALVHASILAARAYPLPVPRRETAGIVLATGLMAVVVALALAVPGPWGLLVQVASGVATYGTVLLVLGWLGLLPLVARSVPGPAAAPQAHGGARHRGEVVPGALVVAGGDAGEALEPVKLLGPGRR